MVVVIHTSKSKSQCKCQDWVDASQFYVRSQKSIMMRTITDVGQLGISAASEILT